MKTQTYTKINTLYRRFMNLGKVELPDKRWMKFQNKIITGQFTDPATQYLRDCEWDCFSKIDGTNTKIVFLPSTGQCFFGGKTDAADLKQHFKIMPEIVERITPKLKEMFPPENAKFTPILNDKQQIQYFHEDGCEVSDINSELKEGFRRFGVELEESPIYIYGELYGPGVQKGGHYGDNLRFAVFDICQQGWFVPIGMLTEMCNNLGLDMVPYLGKMTLKEAESMVIHGFKTMVENAKDKDYIEEGIVARPVVPVKDTRGKRMIVKIKHCDYADLNRAISEVGPEVYHAFCDWYFAHQDEIEAAGRQPE